MLTDIKDQGSCGSCWAFASAETAESAAAIASDATPVALSPQQLVDCDGDSFGCDGGYASTALAWVMDNEGLASSSAYPYEGAAGTCTDGDDDDAAAIAGGAIDAMDYYYDMSAAQLANEASASATEESSSN